MRNTMMRRMLSTTHLVQKNRLVLQFPGQGSQFVGMAKDLCINFPCAQHVINEIDEELGFSLSKIMFEGDDEQLKLTSNTQPAILAHSMAVLSILKQELGYPEDWKVGALLGHSLGEYSALVAAGSLSIPDAARLLRLRGDAMQRAVPVGVGAMAALMPITLDDTISLIAKTKALTTADVARYADSGVLDIANVNAPNQVVVSGHAGMVQAAIKLAKELKLVRKAVILPVSAPFHSRLLLPAAEELRHGMEYIDFESPKFPLISNVTAKVVQNASFIKDLLVEQVTAPVLWSQSMELAATMTNDKRAVDEATDSANSMTPLMVIEIGPGNVLSGLAPRISKEALVTRSLGTYVEVAAFITEMQRSSN